LTTPTLKEAWEEHYCKTLASSQYQVFREVENCKLDLDHKGPVLGTSGVARQA
jgi:hypothetical protein